MKGVHVLSLHFWYPGSVEGGEVDVDVYVVV